MDQYIAYYRVSTTKQGSSGLGLQAQRAAVASYTKIPGLVLAEYEDIESGKNNHRPELSKAIAHAKKAGATLIIAKLDRLSRNAGFIFTLKDSGVKFVCADMPEANTLTIGIFAVLAQHERELISKRTSDALQEKKKAGYRLGTPANLTRQAIEKSVQVRIEKARINPNSVRATNYIKSMRDKEGLSFQAIAERLNREGFKTPEGKSFTNMQVIRLYKRVNTLT